MFLVVLEILFHSGDQAVKSVVAAGASTVALPELHRIL